jgi:hypothetical protein
MNKQIKNVLLVGITILLFSACRQTEAVSAPAPMVTSSPVEIKDSPTAVLATGLVPEKFSKYIGLNYSQIPEGLSHQFSMLIESANDHSLSLVSDGQNKMLWLSKLTHHDSSGNAYWEVKDVLDLSDLESGLTLIPDGCSLNGEPDSEILVAGRDKVITLAWRANTTLNVFEVIPTNGIECHSDKGTILE